MAFAVGTMTRGFAAAPMGQRERAGKSVEGNAKTGKEFLFAAAEPGDGRSRGLVCLPKTVKHPQVHKFRGA
jgi:hypothetical protein